MPLPESQSNIADKTCEIDNALVQLDNEASGYLGENSVSNGTHESSPNQVLKRKYQEEDAECRQLYIEVIELEGDIRVFCRHRPLNANEITNGSAVSVISFDSSPNDTQVICSGSSKKQFKFHHVFRPEDNLEAIFAQTKPIVTSVMGGYNVGIFAYGQIGTGKTFDDGGNNSIMLVARFNLVQKGGGRVGIVVDMPSMSSRPPLRIP
ncbi:hypothetical protein VNO77_03408 [Canavalia gladiata]|uniref:Kinesin motor domain-containing protein n=1 Tax=Canavalia gladiata TaxID=3824 RepID=A0AAN9R847_CANGL